MGVAPVAGIGAFLLVATLALLCALSLVIGVGAAIVRLLP